MAYTGNTILSHFCKFFSGHALEKIYKSNISAYNQLVRLHRLPLDTCTHCPLSGCVQSEFEFSTPNGNAELRTVFRTKILSIRERAYSCPNVESLAFVHHMHTRIHAHTHRYRAAAARESRARANRTNVQDRDGATVRTSNFRILYLEATECFVSHFVFAHKRRHNSVRLSHRTI